MPTRSTSGGCFEPNTILPTQFFTALQRGGASTGEQKLMFAMLADAAAVYARVSEPGTAKTRHILHETRRWLGSSDRTWIFSFLNVCDMLGLDAQYIRRGLRELRERSRAIAAAA
jgi:hypothetical protein